jgi:hypothetical protein
VLNLHLYPNDPLVSLTVLCCAVNAIKLNHSLPQPQKRLLDFSFWEPKVTQVAQGTDFRTSQCGTPYLLQAGRRRLSCANFSAPKNLSRSCDIRLYLSDGPGKSSSVVRLPHHYPANSRPHACVPLAQLVLQKPPTIYNVIRDTATTFNPAPLHVIDLPS